MRASTYALAVLWSCVLVAAAHAQGFCPVDRYKFQTQTLAPPVEIPDDDPQGIVLSKIEFPPEIGFIIVDVIVELEIEHTWSGDLVVTLQHTSSTGDVKAVNLLNRCPELTGTCAASLVRTTDGGITKTRYLFGTNGTLGPLGGTASAPSPVCSQSSSPIPGGCYAVAPGQTEGLEVFRNLPAGDGKWELLLSDHGLFDVGYVHSWTVYAFYVAPVSVSENSWGRIKASYRQ